jgi:hypothetical protein
MGKPALMYGAKGERQFDERPHSIKREFVSFTTPRDPTPRILTRDSWDRGDRGDPKGPMGPRTSYETYIVLYYVIVGA